MKKTDSFNPESITITIGGVEVKPYVMKKYYNISLVQTGDNSYEIKPCYNTLFGSNSFDTEEEANKCIEWMNNEISNGAFKNHKGLSIDSIIDGLVIKYKRVVYYEETYN